MNEVLIKKRKVVIVGGGFAGLNLAKRLITDKLYSITLIDRNNYNYFPPLLYQVATSFLDPSSISAPFRKLFRNGRLAFRMAEVVRVDPATKTLILNNGDLSYDILVFAAGGKVNFFGNENIRRYAIPMKTIDDALRMRNAMVRTMEKASITKDHEERKKLLTIVIAGGGPTGVEVAGMLAEMKKYILPRDYPELKDEQVNLYVVDGGPALLLPMSDKTHREAYQILSERGVSIKLRSRVKDYDGERVLLDDGTEIKAGTMIWAAGITAHTFGGIPEASTGIGKRMLTDEYGRVKNVPDVYAIGDAALHTNDLRYPHGHPQVAQPAIQMGKALAANLRALAREQPLKPFIYADKGDMAIIGRTRAVVDLFGHKLHINGLPGLFIWLFIHLMSLVSFRNKFITFYDWASAYLSRDRSLRMIFRTEKTE
ncbi:NAD(P)/FAD-dependent oxidoreductase [Mucilaginibacter conchicola]|uniref:NADH:ubiquinone reductase (non-electrogenic) n=1 Tax=Mucilaginibacter conchicola TaxID=2303333 RepID=A0A372NQE6_9SPHI|nr:NAD(P)/FAD-dependent oxidoreductase [Mucilaginibacter conchicola]RFZ91156.1 NAD(P)/FAD-dependent oxidoreductase [Mucilaginibacter conchicola]